MSTTVAAETLTAEDIKALRLARSVSFHVFTRDGERVSFIRASFERRRDVFTAAEQRLFPGVSEYRPEERDREIPVLEDIRGYERDGSVKYDERATAFSMIHAAQFDRDWQTIVGLLRPGDELTLTFTASNNSENMRRVGYHRDELRLEVKRGRREIAGGRGQKRLSFLLDVSVGPNDSARMVRS